MKYQGGPPVRIEIVLPQGDDPFPLPDGVLRVISYSGGWIDSFRLIGQVAEELPIGTAVALIVLDHRKARELAEQERSEKKDGKGN